MLTEPSKQGLLLEGSAAHRPAGTPHTPVPGRALAPRTRTPETGCTAPQPPGSSLASAAPAGGKDKAPSQRGRRESSQGTRSVRPCRVRPRPATAALPRPRPRAEMPHLGPPVPGPPTGLPKQERPGTAPGELRWRRGPSQGQCQSPSPSRRCRPQDQAASRYLRRHSRVGGRACAETRPNGSRAGPNVAREGARGTRDSGG